MKMVKCKKCGKIYPKDISNCPECFQKNKKYVSKGRKIAGIIIIVFGLILFISAIISWNDNSVGDYEGSSQSQTISDNGSADNKQETKGKVNYENFEKIENGMTYEQVVKIFGEEGEILSEADMGIGDEYATAIYCWYDWTGVANCNVTFQGGKVIAKAQIGLK